jgi:hypothetical protein
MTLAQLASRRVTPAAGHGLRGFVFRLLACVGILTTVSLEAQAQTVGCVIASNDVHKGFRTDEIYGCRVNTANGKVTFVTNQKSRSRSYTGKQQMTEQHREIAKYWLQRVDQLQFTPRYNRAGFDVRAFLHAAARATDGSVLIRKKRNGKKAVNIVYITDGVYRSIDFDSKDTGKMPSGFLTTNR